MKKVVIIICILILNIHCFSQKRILISCEKTNPTKIMLILENNGNTTKIIDIERNLEDFDYLGIVEIKSSKSSFCLFSEYSSPAGLTKYYYFDWKKQLLYITDFFSETEFVHFFSLDEEKGKIYYVSINNKDCGQILSKKVKVQKISDESINKNFSKTIKAIKICD